MPVVDLNTPKLSFPVFELKLISCSEILSICCSLNCSSRWYMLYQHSVITTNKVSVPIWDRQERRKKDQAITPKSKLFVFSSEKKRTTFRFLKGLLFCREVGKGLGGRGVVQCWTAWSRVTYYSYPITDEHVSLSVI